jgi:hypothetical protein
MPNGYVWRHGEPPEFVGEIDVAAEMAKPTTLLVVSFHEQVEWDTIQRGLLMIARDVRHQVVREQVEIAGIPLSWLNDDAGIP